MRRTADQVVQHGVRWCHRKTTKHSGFKKRTLPWKNQTFLWYCNAVVWRLFSTLPVQGHSLFSLLPKKKDLETRLWCVLSTFKTWCAAKKTLNSLFFVGMVSLEDFLAADCHSRRSSLSSLLWCAWWTGQRVETTMNSGSCTHWTWDHLTLLGSGL